MSSKILSIAGINFDIHHPDDVCIKEEDQFYTPFWGTGDTQSPAINLTVELVLDDMPDLTGVEKIFDTHQAWSMYRQGEICWLVFKPPRYEEPIRIVRFSKGFSAVDLFLNPNYVSQKGEKRIIANPLHYPLDQLLLIYLMASHKGILIHAAGASIQKQGLVFAGKSGAGKSTLAKQLVKGKEWRILSDDRMILREIDGQYTAHGTPWPGEAGHALNQHIPLRNLVFLHHGEKNKLQEISSQSALERLTHVTSIPWYDREVMPVVLEHCQKLVDAVPAFDLYFTPDEGIAPFLSKQLT